jgi:hypothetical protein
MVPPQVREGILTVLVLYRRAALAGPVGAIVAVAVLVTPVTITLNRGNVADSR